MSLDFSIEIDDDADTAEELIRLAFERARKVATENPGQALKGFRIVICDDDDKPLFEVTVAPPTRH